MNQDEDYKITEAEKPESPKLVNLESDESESPESSEAKMKEPKLQEMVEPALQEMVEPALQELPASGNGGKQGRIYLVGKLMAAFGCALMLLSLILPFIRMTDPNGTVTSMRLKEMFLVGMEGLEAGMYVEDVLLFLSCALIVYFMYANKRKKARWGALLALLVELFDLLFFAGFVAQYGPDDVSVFPVYGLWFMTAGCLLVWIATFLHRRKKKPKKAGKGRRGKKADDPHGFEEYDPEFADEEESEEDGAGDKDGKKLYREMKKKQKQEQIERMKNARNTKQ